MNKPSGGKAYSNVNKDYTLDNVQSIVASVLSSRDSKLLIGTTGSSGRNEDYSRLDELEILAYHPEGSEYEVVALARILEEALQDSCELGVEQKSFHMPEMYEGRGTMILEKPQFFPSRFIDYAQLYGSEDDYYELVSTFITNIQGKTGKQISDWRNRVASHRKASNSGVISWKGTESKMFDDDTRAINYSKVPGGHEVSLKIGALRYIQYKIVQLIMALIRKQRLDAQGFGEIGQSVEQKLDFLGEQNVGLSIIQLQELKGLYSFFLGIHNTLSKKFQKNGEGNIVLSDDDYKQFKENLDDFNTIMGEFNLKN